MGVGVVVVKEGWDRALTGLPEDCPIQSYPPMMMAAIEFGLSMGTRPNAVECEQTVSW